MSNLIMTRLLITILFLSVLLPASSQALQLSAAILNLPNNHSGMLHWTDGRDDTKEIQLSTRYFSKSFKVNGQQVHFFADAVSFPLPKGSARPEPLFTLNIPEDLSSAYLVLNTSYGDNGDVKWQGQLMSASDFTTGSMKLFNATGGPVGLILADKKIGLMPGKTHDLYAEDWKGSFPVTMYQVKPEVKKVFSSSWRIAERRREICYLSKINGRYKIRTLLVLNDAAMSQTE